MNIYIIENRDIDDGYMSIEGIFSEELVATEESKLIGEPFWHEIAVTKHAMKHLTNHAYVVQVDNSLKYNVFSAEYEAKAYASSLSLDYSNITKYLINHI